MKEQIVLSKLFSCEPEWEIDRVKNLVFKFKKDIIINPKDCLEVTDYKKYSATIEFEDIKDIQIFDSNIRIELEDSYKVVRR